MNRSATGARYWRFRWFLVVVLLLGCASMASAQTGPSIVRVEEDWEMVVGYPAPARNAPQIVTMISPLGHADSFHATLDLNYHSVPSYAAGGLQFEVWEGEVALLERRFPNQSLLETPGETVRWTQVMNLDGVALKFEIINGSSTTWGNFGGQGYLRDTVVTTLHDLNGYSPAVSVANSGVSFSGNRVQSLVLKRVRYHTASGEVTEDNTERVVHSHD